jgi:hypothetical protein
MNTVVQRREVANAGPCCGSVVLARGPIPDDLLERIRALSELPSSSADRIAQQLNGKGIIAGMGGIR